MEYCVREMRSQDIPGVLALQRLAFPPPFDPSLLWQREYLSRHLDVFPEAQFVALNPNGCVVGSASNCLISRERWSNHTTWEEAVGGYMFSAFDPDGSVLFGADVSVHPDHRKRGIARSLYEARFDLCRHRVWKYATACRLPGAREAISMTGTVENYVEQVAKGNLADPTLSPLLKMGLRITGVAHNYMHDEESLDCACRLEYVQ